jgi:hypothetical protein
MEDMVRKGRQAKGERHGMHKLTQKEINAIRLVDAEIGISLSFLADIYKVTYANIWAIVNGASWRKTP